jgi:hypothetical protein
MKVVQGWILEGRGEACLTASGSWLKLWRVICYFMGFPGGEVMVCPDFGYDLCSMLLSATSDC